MLSGTLLDTHYSKHHKTYVMKYNEKLDMVEAALNKKDLKAVASFAKELRFFGGGHYNHTFFWESLAPVKDGGGHIPDKNSDLQVMMQKSWGSLNNFINFFNSETSKVMGSGWGWLVYNKSSKCLEYRLTKDQDLLSDY